MSDITFRRLGLLALLAFGACDSGPSGPGALGAVVSGTPAAGAVVLEVVGPGIEGFDGEGDTQVFAALVSQVEGRHRVVLIGSGVGEMPFKIRVSDLDAPPPAVSVVEAVGADNRSMLAGGLTVRIVR